MLGIWGVFGFLGSSLGPLIGATIILTVGNIDSSSSATKTLIGKESGDSVGDSGENAEDSMNKYYSWIVRRTPFLKEMKITCLVQEGEGGNGPFAFEPSVLKIAYSKGKII